MPSYSFRCPQRSTLSILAGWSMMAWFSMPIQAQASTTEQRAFIAAEQAWRSGDQARYRQHKAQLQQYPLLPYLEYAEIEGKLENTAETSIRKFLERYPGSVPAQRLRRSWMEMLANQERWETFLEFRDPQETSASLQCHYLNYQIQQGQQTQAFAAIKPLWLQGKAQPSSCDTVFSAWRLAGYLTDELLWARFQLALEAGDEGLLQRLKVQLPVDEQPWAELWLNLRENPRRLLTEPLAAQAGTERTALLVDGFRRLLKNQPGEAASHWKRLCDQYPFLKAKTPSLAGDIALAQVRSGAERPLELLDAVKATADNLGFQQQRLRYAITEEHWRRVAEWVMQLPEKERKAAQWRYWLARALQQLGQQAEAQRLYALAAEERDYYGFLAADRSGKSYRLNHKPMPVTPDLLRQVEKHAATRRTREWVAMERWTEANREWNNLISSLNPQQQLAAVRLCHQWGWHHQAIATSARIGYWDDLEIRFPVEHSQEARHHVQDRSADLTWVMGIIRQESAFNERAVSPTGARGLMQLMPGTAKEVAGQLKINAPKESELHNPQLNIRLGSAYLDRMYRHLDHNSMLATAAYNAGPGRVKSWLPEESPVSADIWVERIPFNETREYVKRVLTYAIIYSERLKVPAIRISARMPEVKPRS